MVTCLSSQPVTHTIAHTHSHPQTKQEMVEFLVDVWVEDGLY
jgi:hypothetical protein